MRGWRSWCAGREERAGLDRRMAFFLYLLLAAGITVVGRAEVPPSSAPASAPAATQPTTSAAVRRPVAEAAEAARTWVGRYATETPVEAYGPAADIRYRTYDSPRPLRMWIARVDLGHPGVRLTVTEPTKLPDEDGSSRETLCVNTLQFARHCGAQLAVNASAFGPLRPKMGMTMDVVGLAAVEGRVYSRPDERFGAMYISREGRVALKAPPLPTEDVWDVLAGFRMLLDDGRLAVTQQEADTLFGGLNPRTAVGVDRDGGTLWLVVVDGRQKGVSEGVTVVELACLFESLGVWDALNLDGGGSSAMVVERQDGGHTVLNTPINKDQPGGLRQVANNLGVYLPGRGPAALADQPKDLREAVVRTVAGRRGGGYEWAGDGVSKDIGYDGQVFLRANPGGTFCCGATLEAFLDAYCWWRGRGESAGGAGRWFENWPIEKMVTLKRGWWGLEEAADDPLLPEEARPTIRERQVSHMAPWTGLGRPLDNYRLLQRGDFVQFWRKSGTGHSVVFWMCDRDATGKERFWYWSSQPQPRYAYPRGRGGEAEALPGWGLNWEYVEEEIDPQRIYGARLADADEK